MENDFKISLQGIVDEIATGRRISDALKRLEKQAIIKTALNISADKNNLNKEVLKIKSKFSDLRVNIDDKDALKAINTTQKAYVNLRKEVYQSIGKKSPELQAMADYYKEAEKEAERLDKIQKNNNLKQQLNYYDKIKSEVKIIADLEKKIANLHSQQNLGKVPVDSYEVQETKRQLKNAVSRKKYNESQLDKKGLRSNSLDREVNDLSSSLSNRNAINSSKLLDKEVLASEQKITKEQEAQAKARQEAYDFLKKQISLLESAKSKKTYGDSTEVDELIKDFNSDLSKLTDGSLEKSKLNEYSKQVSNQMEEYSKQVSEVINKLQLSHNEKLQSDKIRLTVDTSSIEKQIYDVQKKFDSLGDFNGDITAQANFQSQITNINKLKESLTSALNSDDDEKIIDTFNQLNVAIKKCNNELSMQTKSVSALDRQTFSNKITTWLKNNTAAGADLRATLELIREKAKSCDAVEFDNLKKEFKEVITAAEATGQTGRSLFNELQNNAKKFTQWFSVSQVVMKGVEEVKKMVSAVYEIDTAMTELYKVTDETDSRYQKFLTDSTSNAKKLGRSVSSLIEQSATWAKLGYSITQSEELSKASSIYSNVGEVDDETAVADMVTVMKAYDMNSPNQAMNIVDKLNELGNNYATDAKSLGEGIKNMASTMSMAGVSLDKSLAILTGGSEITQNAGELGNAIKVAVLRLRGQKGQLEELGEESEGIETVSKMQTQILNLTKGAVNIMDSADPTSFRDYYDIMADIAEVLPKLQENDQANLIELLFGKNRANQGQSILKSFQSGKIQEALESAQNASGSAMKEQERLMDSLEADFASLRRNA